VSERGLFYYPCGSFTNTQFPLLKVAARYFDKLVILDAVGASRVTISADGQEYATVKQLRNKMGQAGFLAVIRHQQKKKHNLCETNNGTRKGESKMNLFKF
jgi:hypothetical protein